MFQNNNLLAGFRRHGMPAALRPCSILELVLNSTKDSLDFSGQREDYLRNNHRDAHQGSHRIPELSGIP